MRGISYKTANLIFGSIRISYKGIELLTVIEEPTDHFNSNMWRPLAAAVEILSLRACKKRG